LLQLLSKTNLLLEGCSMNSHGSLPVQESIERRSRIFHSLFWRAKRGELPPEGEKRGHTLLYYYRRILLGSGSTLVSRETDALNALDFSLTACLFHMFFTCTDHQHHPGSHFDSTKEPWQQPPKWRQYPRDVPCSTTCQRLITHLMLKKPWRLRTPLRSGTNLTTCFQNGKVNILVC
jgi:hypothetical protein